MKGTDEIKANLNNEDKFWYTLVSSAMVGGVTAFLCYPFAGLKKRKQSGQPINLASFYPKNLFLGASSFSFSMGLSSVTQLSLNKIITENAENPQSESTKRWSAIVSGVAGGLALTPIEHIMLTQQLQKCGPLEAIRHMVQNGGYARPLTGVGPICFRELVFGSSTLYYAEAAAKYFKKKFGDSEIIGFMGTMSLGVTASLVTHPIDTIATRKQKHIDRINIFRMAQIIYSEGSKISVYEGIKGFYLGGLWRIFLFAGCMIGISWNKERTYEMVKAADQAITSKSKIQPHSVSVNSQTIFSQNSVYRTKEQENNTNSSYKSVTPHE